MMAIGDGAFLIGWEFVKANTPCCPNRRMVERKDGTMRCRVCGTVDRSDLSKFVKEDPCWDGYEQVGMKTKRGKKVPNCVPSDTKKSACDCDTCYSLAKALLSKESNKPFIGYNPNRHSREGGLNAKGRAKFKREEGANLKPPVTEKPSTLDPNSKKAKRRKSFCARMGGVKGPTSKGGKLTPKGAALKRWNC